MKYHPACRDCILKNYCLLRKNDDVESCDDVQYFDAGLDWPDDKNISSPDESSGAGR